MIYCTVNLTIYNDNQHTIRELKSTSYIYMKTLQWAMLALKMNSKKAFGVHTIEKYFEVIRSLIY